MSAYYHSDHNGGLAGIAAKFPIQTIVDHGANVELGKSDEWWKGRRNDLQSGLANQTDDEHRAYLKICDQHRHLVVKPGHRVPITGLDAQVLAAGERSYQAGRRLVDFLFTLSAPPSAHTQRVCYSIFDVPWACCLEIGYLKNDISAFYAVRRQSEGRFSERRRRFGSGLSKEFRISISSWSLESKAVSRLGPPSLACHRSP